MQRARGFTLIELLVVFAIMALLVGLTPVAFDRMRDAVQYRDTVRAIIGELRGARSSAIGQGREIRFYINLSHRTYGLDVGGEKILPDSVDVRAIVAGAEFSRGGEAAIRFLPDGGATGGSIDIVRASSGVGVRLRVDWLSGRVTQESLVL